MIGNNHNVHIGATDPAAETIKVQTGANAFLRRLVAPHLLRETFIVPVHDGAARQGSAW